MSVQLYVSNLPEGATEAKLGELFAPVGEVQQVTFLERYQTGELWNRAIVDLEVSSDDGTLPQGFWDQYNGHEFGDPYLVVTPATMERGPEAPYPTPEEWDKAHEIAKVLGETKRGVRFQIAMVIRFCGEGFAQRMVDEAIAIEEAGGMLVGDGSRPRTRGGIFFYLVRGYVRGSTARAIFRALKRYTRQEIAQRTAKQQSQEQQGAAPVQEEAHPEPVAEPAEVQSPENGLDVARRQLEELRQTNEAAQARLEAVKAGKAKEATGVLSLIKKVMDTSREIEQLIEKYPELG
jgi:hypothetical protein